MANRPCAYGQCRGPEGCATLEAFDIEHGRAPEIFVAVTQRCHEYNIAGGRDGLRIAGTVCFLEDASNLRIALLSETEEQPQLEVTQEPVHA